MLCVFIGHSCWPAQLLCKPPLFAAICCALTAKITSSLLRGCSEQGSVMNMPVVTRCVQIKLFPFCKWKGKKGPLSACVCVIVAVFLKGRNCFRECYELIKSSTRLQSAGLSVTKESWGWSARGLGATGKALTEAPVSCVSEAMSSGVTRSLEKLGV